MCQYLIFSVMTINNELLYLGTSQFVARWIMNIIPSNSLRNATIERTQNQYLKKKLPTK
jgi:hypothetical protein